MIADIIEQPALVQANSNRRSVSTLKPCAKDAYMLFQVFQLIKIIFIIIYSFEFYILEFYVIYIFKVSIFKIVKFYSVKVVFKKSSKTLKS